MQVVDTIFSDLTLSVIASQCHLSQRERQVRSQIQLLLTVKMPWLPLWGNNNDRRQWRIEGGVVGAAASKIRMQFIA